MEADGLTFHHYSISVKDVRKSSDFYSKILGLVRIKRPDFSFEGAWFSIGVGLELHLIADDTSVIPYSGSRQLHYAFKVKDLYAFRQFLLDKNVHIEKDINLRPDGVLQLFIKDPDGYFIEITCI